MELPKLVVNSSCYEGFWKKTNVTSASTCERIWNRFNNTGESILYP